MTGLDGAWTDLGIVVVENLLDVRSGSGSSCSSGTMQRVIRNRSISKHNTRLSNGLYFDSVIQLTCTPSIDKIRNVACLHKGRASEMDKLCQI